MNLAPIALFVFNRPEHTARTLEALAKNPLAKHSALIVFADGPRAFPNQPEREALEKQKCLEVQEIIKTQQGFLAIELRARDKNAGLAQSIIEGVSSVIRTHGKIIVLEDDLITSPIFLDWMNRGLQTFEEDESVAEIHGYSMPFPKTELAYYLKGADCWGWATWKRAWDLFEANGTQLLQTIRQRKLEKEFDLYGAYPYTQMLQDQIDGRVNSWAIRWHASCFLHNKLCLYPGQSLIQNIGFDASGTHCTEDPRYTIPYLAEDIETLWQAALITPKEQNFALVQRIKAHLKPPLHLRILRKLKNLV
jgi:hypothetical protein